MKRSLAALIRMILSRLSWMVLGSVVFVVAMTYLPSVPFGQGNRDDPDDDTPPLHVPRFMAGFISACVLIGVWVYDYKRQNPKWTGKLRGPVWDHESGQLVVPKFCIAEGNKRPWVACLREQKTGEMHMLELEANTFGRDLDYGEDIHIIPCKLSEENAFDGHDFSRSCRCIPVIMEQVRGRTLVIHSEKDHRIS